MEWRRGTVGQDRDQGDSGEADKQRKEKVTVEAAGDNVRWQVQREDAAWEDSQCPRRHPEPQKAVAEAGRGGGGELSLLSSLRKLRVPDPPSPDAQPHRGPQAWLPRNPPAL